MSGPTRTQLMELLDAAGVEYPADARRDKLIELVDEHAPTLSGSVESPPARPVWEGGESRREYQQRLQQWLLDHNEAR